MKDVLVTGCAGFIGAEVRALLMKSGYHVIGVDSLIYHGLFGIDVTVLRYFSVYGPAGRPDMSIFRLIRWIADGEQIILYGDGTQERDFTFVEDIARGTMQALRPVGREVINLGNEHPVSLRRVIALLERTLDRTARLKQEPSHPADAFATWADIRKARLLLGWKPHTSFEQGLQAAVEWYLANRAWASEILLGDSADPQPQPEQA